MKSATVAWPPYLIQKELRSGAVAYYWNPPVADLKAGFSLHREALGKSFPAAYARATVLNQHLYEFRSGRGAKKSFEHHPGRGTVDWLVESYDRSRSFSFVSARSKDDYRSAFKIVTDIRMLNGARFGGAQLRNISAQAVDKLYTDYLLVNAKGRRRSRMAEVCIVRMAHAWNVVQRLEPKIVPLANPWKGVKLENDRQEVKPATRAQAFALADAILARGHPHLAIVPLICFEWLQRPENVLAGHLRWADIRPDDHPTKANIFHHKTKQQACSRSRTNSAGSTPSSRIGLRRCHGLAMRLC